MSATNIDKSLTEIISSRKTSTRGGRRGGRKGAARAPVGGVAKAVAKAAAKAPTKAAAAAAAAAAVAATASKGNKKIMVSGLPTDVSEEQIKDYFGSRVGPISRIELSYGPNGVSRGVATIIFRQDHAQKAVSEHNGVKVDGKPMKVEVVYDAKHLPPVQPAKSLGDRVVEPRKERAAKKEQPKKDGPKKVKAEAEKPARGGRRTRAQGRKKKTAEDLDAEMADYFDVKQANGEAAAAAAPAAAAPAGGDQAMDEVL